MHLAFCNTSGNLTSTFDTTSQSQTGRLNVLKPVLILPSLTQLGKPIWVSPRIGKAIPTWRPKTVPECISSWNAHDLTMTMTWKQLETNSSHWRCQCLKNHQLITRMKLLWSRCIPEGNCQPTCCLRAHHHWPLLWQRYKLYTVGIWRVASLNWFHKPQINRQINIIYLLNYHTLAYHVFPSCGLTSLLKPFHSPFHISLWRASSFNNHHWSTYIPS